MLSKNQQKHIRQLSKKKYRQETGLFVAEGEKTVFDLLDAGWKTDEIYATKGFKNIPYTKVDVVEMGKITHLSTPSSLLAVFYIPKYTSDLWIRGGFSLALDGVSDPGNLGTIIRLCDWFGVKNIFCSPNTVDCYNPKVIQSTMGSIARVTCQYTDLHQLVEHFGGEIFAATLDGISHYGQSFPTNGLLIMGSESHGIDADLLKKIKNHLTIEGHFNGPKAESLNVGTATAILLSEIFRPV